MKKKNKRLYSVVALVLAFVFLFSISSSALDILGVHYTLTDSLRYSPSLYPGINLQYKFYDNFLGSSPSFSATRFTFLLNSLLNVFGYGKSGNWNDTVFLNHLEMFNGGYHSFGSSVTGLTDCVGDFITTYNSYWFQMTVQSSNGPGLDHIRDGSYNFIFIYNIDFCTLFETNVVSFLEWCVDNGYIITDGLDIAHTFETSYLYTSAQTDIWSRSTDSDLLYFQCIYESSPYIRFPISPHFDFSTSINYLKNPNTWNFLPTSIANLLLSFIVTVASLALLFGVSKKLF